MPLRKQSDVSPAGGPMTLRLGWPHDPAKIGAEWPHEAANWQAANYGSELRERELGQRSMFSERYSRSYW